MRVGRRACVQRAAASGGAERLGEHVAEGAAHGAVDDEVGRIAEQDDEVADERRDGAGVAVEQPQRERVLRDGQQQDDGLRQFDGEEHGDHGDQHQSRAAALRQTTSTDNFPVVVAAGGHRAVAWAPRSLQQAPFALLGTAHRAHEKYVQDDEHEARNEVNEHHAEPEDTVEVHLNTQSP